MPTLAPRTSQEEIDALFEQASAAAADRRKQKRARQKKIIVAAVIGSILLHIILVPLLSWVAAHWPRKPMRGSSPFQLSIVRSSDEEKQNANAQATQTAKPYMRTTAEQQAEKPPEKEDFISDKDTLAAADQPPDPNKPPLPSQMGREIPTYDFDTTPNRPGKEASEAASAAAAQASQENAPTPNQTPQPDRQSRNPDSKTKTSPRNAQPTPTPQPDGELAMVKAEPTPADQPPKPEETPSDTPPPPSRRSASQPNSASSNSNSVNSTGLPRTPGYQPQTIQSKMTGSINNRGRPAIMARATPLGRYEKAVQDAIGSVWYMDVERQLSTIMTSSEVRLHFYVTRAGVVRGVRVSGGDENSSLASISFGAVTQAQIAPMPSEVSAVLPGGELEVDMGFALFAQ